MDKLEKAQKAARKHLSNNLKSFRAKLNISQEALSERAGFHRTYISQVERQTTNPTLNNVVAIAVALDVKLTDLLSEDDGPPATLKQGRRPSKSSA
ncbi:helix-turn-helix domain-containing protein [Paraburkholderia caribensis]|uniref:helix-turn-helix domain-containing protein n=1 Tax=Paraburkholderia TaxID=1822464 RepID=UPI0034D155C2